MSETAATYSSITPEDLDRLRAFTDEFADVMESRGLPRMAGRLFGWLLVCEPDEQNAAQLAEALGASRGTISDMTRLLQQAGLIERRGRSGQRGIVYRVAPGTPSLFLRAAIQPLRLRRMVAEHGLELLRDRPAEVRARLQELVDVYSFFEERYPAMLQEWEQSRKGTGR